MKGKILIKMKKNSEIHLKLETDLIDKLKKQAVNDDISFSELCRKRLKDNIQLDRIEALILEINKKLSI